MRTWHLTRNDPRHLILAADARQIQTDYTDDQIWEISLTGGEPPALALQTTYGLRARLLRLFPRFSEGPISVSDPAEYKTPPVIEYSLPNYAALSCTPVPGLDVTLEVWVPHSHGITGRIQVTNCAALRRSLRVEWLAILSPINGTRMAPDLIDNRPVLIGKTEGLFPVVILSAAADTRTPLYPGLGVNLDLTPHETRAFTWAAAAGPDRQSSYEAARHLAEAYPEPQWPALRARLFMLNSHTLEISTGDPEWDIAFDLAQKAALQAFIGPTTALPERTFVQARLPDQGYSRRGDGSDYNHLWSGQTALQAYFLSDLVLLSAPELVQGMIFNFLATQDESGAIDWRPGPAGQRTRRLATPILTTLSWRIFSVTQDHQFLRRVYPALLSFIRLWFSPRHDRDQDGLPEWDHPLQAGLEDSPLFARTQDWAHGLDIVSVESPALAAMLYSECQALQQMAAILQQEAPPELQLWQTQLHQAVQQTWDDKLGCFLYRDRDSHLSQPLALLGERQGPGLIAPSLDSLAEPGSSPLRLLFEIELEEARQPSPQIFVHGQQHKPAGSATRVIEQLESESFHWYLGRGFLTGSKLYDRVEKVEFENAGPNDRLRLYRAGYCGLDLSLLLPLWAGMASSEQAQRAIQATLCHPQRFWQAYGLPVYCPVGQLTQAEATAGCDRPLPAFDPVDIPWNALIGAGLLRYGHQKESAALFQRLMAAIVRSLKQEGAFRQHHSAAQGQGIGLANILSGLPPLGWFLDLIGVRFSFTRGLNEWPDIQLQGFNPFPWPITVKYRGITVIRQKEKTIVILPDGQSTEIADPAPCQISLALSNEQR